MSLENWRQFDWLQAETSSEEELKSLLSIVDRSLKDADVEAISDDLRFVAAFTAALTLANMALRASGYRARTGPGHHQHVTESLELTVGVDTSVLRKLRLFAKKRNFTSYDAAGNISRSDVNELIQLAIELRYDILSWLAQKHPEWKL